jgi:hypothetical protein
MPWTADDLRRTQEHIELLDPAVAGLNANSSDVRTPPTEGRGSSIVISPLLTRIA